MSELTTQMDFEEMIDTLKGLIFGTFDRTTLKEREALNASISLLEKTGNIIKCKDCVFYRNKYCAHNHGLNYPDKEDYCSYAEVKRPTILKSCPFCGSNSVFIFHSLNDDKYTIICPGCDVSIGKFETDEEVVNTWNRRNNDANK